MRGATTIRATLDTVGVISIHAPHAGSDPKTLGKMVDRQISIHAPHAGSDYNHFPYAQPIIFQSTLPMRGATGSPHGFRRYSPDFNPRSPCGERLMHHSIALNALNFNPRSPCGERHYKEGQYAGHNIFQSTLPMRGATCRRPLSAAQRKISIHAPHAGSDTVAASLAAPLLISIHAPHAGSDS